MEKKLQDYEIEIKETLSKIVSVRAESLSDAIANVEEQYRKCDIELYSEDLVSTDFNEYISVAGEGFGISVNNVKKNVLLDNINYLRNLESENNEKNIADEQSKKNFSFKPKKRR